MAFYDLTEQQKKVLSLLREVESQGTPNDYTAVLTATEPDLTTRTIDEVIAKEGDNYRYPVMGAYNLTPETVIALKENLNIPGDTQFTKELQDYLAIQMLNGLGFSEWSDSTLGDIKFQENLASAFPHVPMPKTSETLYETESPYTGTNFANRLNAIKISGPGETTEISIQARSVELPNPGGLVDLPPGGATPSNVSGLLPQSSPLGPAGDPYTYEPMVFGNNRYDFRTGKKVNLYPVIPPQMNSYGVPFSSVPAGGTNGGNNDPATIALTPTRENVGKGYISIESDGSVKSYQIRETPAGIRTVDVTGNNTITAGTSRPAYER